LGWILRKNAFNRNEQQAGEQHVEHEEIQTEK
jgi:hypothetical protein